MEPDTRTGASAGRKVKGLISEDSMESKKEEVSIKVRSAHAHSGPLFYPKIFTT